MIIPLQIKIYRAIIKRDVRTFSQMVPFATIEIGNISNKTLSDQKRDKKPLWNQTLIFKTADTKGKISVFDEDGSKNQLIGVGYFNIEQMDDQINQFAVQLVFQQKIVGKVFMKIIQKYKQKIFSQNSQNDKVYGQEYQNNLNKLALNLIKKDSGLPLDSISLNKSPTKLPQLNSPSNRQQYTKNKQQFLPSNNNNFIQPSINNPPLYNYNQNIYPNNPLNYAIPQISNYPNLPYLATNNNYAANRCINPANHIIIYRIPPQNKVNVSRKQNYQLPHLTRNKNNGIFNIIPNFDNLF